MKKVLLTGATGFIGRHCLPLLIAQGYEVHAVYAKAAGGEHPGLQWHKANLLDPSQIYMLMEEVLPTHLLHFAWYAIPGKYWTSPENVRWVQASQTLLQTFVKHGGHRVVVSGTCAEYDWEQGSCSENTTPLTPVTLYGSCKNTLRESLEAFSRENCLSNAWGRIFFVYGTGEHPNRLVSSVICSLLKGESISCSSGYQKRDFLFVEDVASAFVALLGSDVKGAVNIGSGVAVSVREIIETISEKMGSSDLIRYGELPVPPNDPPLLVADVRRLREEVRWVSRYSLSQGLEKTIEWWKDNLKKR
jgi:nucleoside-diphosphate-sugar epimerase